MNPWSDNQLMNRKQHRNQKGCIGLQLLRVSCGSDMIDKSDGVKWSQSSVVRIYRDRSHFKQQIPD